MSIIGNIFKYCGGMINYPKQGGRAKKGLEKQINKTTQKKYLDNNSTVGLIYRHLEHKVPLNTSLGVFNPTLDGYVVKPASSGIKINGKEILNETKLVKDDWVQIKDLGFQII